MSLAFQKPTLQMKTPQLPRPHTPFSATSILSSRIFPSSHRTKRAHSPQKSSPRATTSCSYPCSAKWARASRACASWVANQQLFRMRARSAMRESILGLCRNALRMSCMALGWCLVVVIVVLGCIPRISVNHERAFIGSRDTFFAEMLFLAL